MLPPELLLKIFGYLNHHQLLTVSLVCKAWNELSNSNSLWKYQCLEMWKDKVMTQMQLAHRMDYANLIDDLSIRDMKDILLLRNVPLRGLFEKSDLVKSVLSTTPRHCPVGSWRPKWKASFISKLLDAKRTVITKEELCKIQWFLDLIKEV
jgi:patatin-like phospholipase/acyl hydrolase